MTHKINKTNFYVSYKQVQLLLDELKIVYPDIAIFDESPSRNLQHVMGLLGWHTRVRTDGSLFTLSRIRPKIDNENYKTTIDILSKYVHGNVIEMSEGTRCDEIVEEIPSIELEDVPEESMVEAVTDISDKEEIKIESIVDSTVVKKKKGGRPRKEIVK